MCNFNFSNGVRTIAFAGILSLVLGACSGSTGATVAKIAIDLTNPICSILSKDLQDDPTVVKYLCQVSSLIEDGGISAIQFYTLRVPVAQQASFESTVKMSGIAVGK